MSPTTIVAIATALGILLGAVLGGGIAWGRSLAERKAMAVQIERLADVMLAASRELAQNSVGLDGLSRRLDEIAAHLEAVHDHESRLARIETAVVIPHEHDRN